MGRMPFYNPQNGLNKGPWTPEEDLVLTMFVREHGEGRWRAVPSKAGLKRCGKSCRLRWVNYLSPKVKHGNITPDEEELIVRLHKLLGNRWSLIAGRIPGRTDNEVKNYWNTHLSKKAANGFISVKPLLPAVKRVAAYHNATNTYQEGPNVKTVAYTENCMAVENLEEESISSLILPANKGKALTAMKEELISYPDAEQIAGFMVKDLSNSSMLNFSNFNHFQKLAIADEETGSTVFSANPFSFSPNMPDHVLSYPNLCQHGDGLQSNCYNCPLSFPVHSETPLANHCSEFFPSLQWSHSWSGIGSAFNYNTMNSDVYEYGNKYLYFN